MSDAVYDAIVVGGGPVGGQAARLLAERGLRTLLVEEHRRVGEPVQCAGLFSPRIFDLVDFPVSRVRLNEVRGAHVWSPKGHRIDLDGGRTMAVAVDRAAFDRECVASAERSGAEVALGSKAVRASRTGDVLVEVRDHSGATREVRARLLVGADGVQAQVAKWFGLPRAREIIPCYGSQMEGLALDPSFVEMFVGREQAPGFFSWMIPTAPDGSQGKVEVGVDVRAPRPARHYYDRMMHDPISRPFVKGAIRSCFDICGCIPLGPIKETVADRVMLVGDAAAQTKPTSGGGVYTGLTCAAHLADVAEVALAEDDLSRGRLREYHERWYDDIGRELWVGWRLRKAFMHLDDGQIEELFDILDDREVLAVVNALGDIDYPSRLAKAMWRKTPQLFKFSGAAIRSLFDA